MKVGFIGTGTMGRPMIANLVKKGFEVLGYDVVPSALQAAVGLGAKATGSSVDAAKGSDIVVTMLPSSSHVESVYLGARGVLGGVARGRLCVDMSTIDPATSRRVAEAARARGIRRRFPRRFFDSERQELFHCRRRPDREAASLLDRKARHGPRRV